MWSPPRPFRPLLLLFLPMLAASWALAGCAELRGRKKIQEGNTAYEHGDFAAAVARFDEAAALVPDMPLLWLNRGYACRERIVPVGVGAVGEAGPASEPGRAAVHREAARCALESFKRLRQLSPGDPRGDILYVQTLLDLGEYKTLERSFSLRHERNPTDLDAVMVLRQVYYKLGRWREALDFYRKAAALRPTDAEAQAAVGTFVWQLLQSRGGGAALADYDPRPRAERKPPPAGTSGDIVGGERVALAEEGIRYLQRAVSLQPRYPDAMTYIGLLYRQESFARFDDPTAWQAAISQAVAFASRAMERK